MSNSYRIMQTTDNNQKVKMKKHINNIPIIKMKMHIYVFITVKISTDYTRRQLRFVSEILIRNKIQINYINDNEETLYGLLDRCNGGDTILVVETAPMLTQKQAFCFLELSDKKNVSFQILNPVSPSELIMNRRRPNPALHLSEGVCNFEPLLKWMVKE